MFFFQIFWTNEKSLKMREISEHWHSGICFPLPLTQSPAQSAELVRKVGREPCNSLESLFSNLVLLDVQRKSACMKEVEDEQFCRDQEAFFQDCFFLLVFCSCYSCFCFCFWSRKVLLWKFVPSPAFVVFAAFAPWLLQLLWLLQLVWLLRLVWLFFFCGSCDFFGFCFLWLLFLLHLGSADVE